MPSTEPPKGQRFSLIYLDRGKPVQDSPRMRHRIGALLEEYPHQVMHDLGQYVERRLGIEARYITPAFLKRADLRDVLDIVTVTHDFLSRKSLGTRGWTANVNIIFDEENVPYMVDDEGGVHFRVDEEFARAIAATIAVLKNTKYANFLDAFERGQASLSEVPPNGKAAIRYVFSAVEGLFRHMFPSAPRLTGQFIEQHLRPFVKKGYSGDQAALGASGKLVGSLIDWTDAAHFYRHEEGKADIVAQPPLGLAIYLISASAAHLRWLAELNLLESAQ